MLFYCMRNVLLSISLSFVLSVANAQGKIEESKANQIKGEQEPPAIGGRLEQLDHTTRS